MVIVIYFAIVLSSVIQSATTKVFNRHSKNAYVFNAVKAMASLALFALMLTRGFTFHIPTLLFGLLYGASLCSSMYAGYRALCLGPMALTSMLASFSVVIPLLWGITVGKERITVLHGIALCLLLGAIILTNADKLVCHRNGKESTVQHAKKNSYGAWLLFVCTSFLCNGICSVLQKQHQTLYPESYNGEFMLFAMLLCTVIFSGISLLKSPPSDIKKTKGIWLGVLSGIANGLANFFTLSLAGFESASILFPVISAGTLLGALLCGRFVFKEKLKINHYFALGFGLVAVILLKL